MSNKKILLIFFFAFLIRLIALNQSLWLDEAVTANVVRNFSFLQIITKFSPTDFHPPLYYLVMKLWTGFFGYSEIALRMPSVLFSLATGWIVYLIGGVWATIFFLFNPLIVYYSQEARMYMMATFFLTASLYYFIKNKNQILFGIFISLAFLTFYGSIFLIISFLLYSLYKKDYKFFLLNTFYLILTTIIISPLLYQQLINSKIVLSNVVNWSATLGKANIKNLLLIPIKFSIGRISFLPKWFYWLIAGGWTGFIICQISKIKNQSDRLKLKDTNMLFLLLIFPLFLGFVVSFFIPMLQYFRFLYLIPVISLLLSINLRNLASSNWTSWILTGGFVLFSLIYLTLPQFHREDWKSLVKNLPKDKPVYMIMASSDPVKYYDSQLKINELASLHPGQREIIIIPYATEIYGLDYKNILNKVGYQLKKEVSFREVTYEQWLKN